MQIFGKPRPWHSVVKWALSVALAWAIFVAQDWYNNRTKYIDYYVYTSEDILASVHDTVTVEVNGIKRSKLTEAHVYLINGSDEDFSDVPIFIELANSNSGEKLKVLSVNYFDHNDSKEGVQIIPTHPPLHHDYRFGFLVKTINRKPNFGTTFTAKFLIEGVAKPAVRVQADQSGLEVRWFNYDNYTGSWLKPPKIYYLMLTVITIMLISGVYDVVKTRQMKKQRQLRKRQVNDANVSQ